jgi:hypothetical protein
MRHRRISRCTIERGSIVLCRRSNGPRGVCRRCPIERFPQTSEAFSFAGDIAISGDFAGGASCIISFGCHFDQAFL